MLGLCECGCGKKTNISKYTMRSKGYVKGEPRRFLVGHRGNLMKGTQYERQPIEERFWKYVEKTDSCWLWTGARSGDRGWIWYNKRYQLAYRVSFQMLKGQIPGGLFVLHSCDNGLCVNPDHLFLGTQKDNIQDAWKKGRMRRENLIQFRTGTGD